MHGPRRAVLSHFRCPQKFKNHYLVKKWWGREACHEHGHTSLRNMRLKIPKSYIKHLRNIAKQAGIKKHTCMFKSREITVRV